MEVQLDIDIIKQNGLSPHLYLFLLYLEEGRKYDWSLSEEELEYLQKESWVRFGSNGIILRPKFAKEFPGRTPLRNTSQKEEVVEDWIESWRELFPVGVKSGGRPVKGDKKGVLKKMKVFVKENPKTTKEDIFRATKNYILEKKQSDYKFMICADYLINKDGSSILSSLIETLEYDSSNSSIIEERGGKFHKEI